MLLAVRDFRDARSQGNTEAEAIENIKIAIKEYIEAIKESYREETFKEIQVAV